MSRTSSSGISARKAKLFLMFFFGLLVFHVGIFVSAKSQDGNNIFQDTDQDGLSNEEEKIYGTDPNNPDTDGDGFTDGAEVKGGYDPLKPAPGDKLVGTPNATAGVGGDELSSDTGDNLTQQVSTQIAGMIQAATETDGKLSTTDITEKIDEILNGQENPEDIQLPEIDASTIKIKKQDYGDLSEEEQKAKISQDTMEYASSAAYIIANNSPVPVQSGTDFNDTIGKFTAEALQASTNHDMAFADDIEQKGKAVLEQLNSLEVPENMLDTHIKGLQIANYAITIKQGVKDDPTDPLSGIYTLSKAQALLGIVTTYYDELDATLGKYGVDNIPILNR